MWPICYKLRKRGGVLAWSLTNIGYLDRDSRNRLLTQMQPLPLDANKKHSEGTTCEIQFYNFSSDTSHEYLHILIVLLFDYALKFLNSLVYIYR